MTNDFEIRIDSEIIRNLEWRYDCMKNATEIIYVDTLKKMLFLFEKMSIDEKLQTIAIYIIKLAVTKSFFKNKGFFSAWFYNIYNLNKSARLINIDYDRKICERYKKRAFEKLRKLLNTVLRLNLKKISEGDSVVLSYDNNTVNNNISYQHNIVDGKLKMSFIQFLIEDEVSMFRFLFLEKQGLVTTLTSYKKYLYDDESISEL